MPESRVRNAGVWIPIDLCACLGCAVDPDLDLDHDLTFYICELILTGLVSRSRTPGTHPIEYTIAWYDLSRWSVR